MILLLPQLCWMDAVPDALILVDGNGTIVYANQRCEDILGWPPGELQGRPVEVLVPARHANHAGFREHFMATPTSRHMGSGLELTAMTYSGEEVHVDIALSPLVLDGVTYVMAAVRDAQTPHEAIQRLILQSIALEAAASGIFITNVNGTIIWVNQAVCRMTGYGVEELIGQKPSLLKSGEHLSDFYADIWATVTKGRIWNGSIINRRKDGSLYYEEQTIAPVQSRTGEITHFIAVKQDVTDRILAERALLETRDELERRVAEVESLHERLREQAIRDSLTGLFNRRYLDESLPRELSRARREQSPVTLVTIDIDRFKSANDRHGHPFGDRLLVKIGGILRTGSRQTDVASRYGGDEFVVLLVGATVAEGRRLAEAWRLEFRDGHVMAGNAFAGATLSAGVAEWLPGESPADLLARADQALYVAKQGGRDRTEVSDGRPGSTAVPR